MEAEKAREYWRSPNDGLNQPERYRDVSPERSIYLVDLFKRLGMPKGAQILEVGPNVGRNLAHLYESGYHNLHGVEINANATKLMRATYPQLKDVEVVNASIEEVARGLPTRGYDVTYTMAVLQHLHPDSTWVFRELARASCMIITIEDEYLDSPLHWRRNYRNIYEARGMRQILCEGCHSIKGLGNHFKTRVFNHTR